MLTCAECGDDLAAGSKFCSACGTRVAADTAAESAAGASVAGAAEAQADAAGAASAAVTEPNLVLSVVEAAVTEAPPAKHPDRAVVPRNDSEPVDAEPVDAELVVAEAAAAQAEVAEQVEAEPVDAELADPYMYPTELNAPRLSFTAEGLGNGAEQARSTVAAGVSAGVERIALPSHQISRALRDGAVLAGLAWAAGTLLVMIGYLLAQLPAGGPLLWIRAGIAVVAASVRADWRLAGSFFGSEAGVTVAVLPTLLTILLAAGAYAVARTAQKASPTLSLRDRMWRAVLAGASFGLVLAVLTVALQGRISPDDRFSIAANPLQSLFGGFVIIALSSFLGLGRGAAPEARLPAAWVTDMRTAVELVVGSLNIIAVLVITPIVIGLIGGADSIVSVLGEALRRDAGGTLVAGALGVFLLVVVVLSLGPTLLAQLGGLLLGGSFVMTFTPRVELGGRDVAGAASALLGLLGQDDVADAMGPQVQRFGMMEGNLPSSLSLVMLLVCAGLVFVVGVRAGLRTPSGRASGAEGPLRWWQPMLLSAGAYMAMLWLTSVRAEGDFNAFDFSTGPFQGSGSFSAGVSVWGTAVAAALLTLAAVALGRYLTPRLGAMAPAMVAFLGGRRIEPTWQVLLTDAMLRRAQRPPAKFAGVADALRSGRIAQPRQPLV